MDLTLGTMQEDMEVNGNKLKVGMDVVGSTKDMSIRAVITSVTIYPEEGNFPTVARMLLAAADHPSQVRTVSHPRSGFEVPEDVYDRFEAAQDSLAAQDQGDEPKARETGKRRGRPRRNVEPVAQPQASDDTGKEE